MVKMQTDNHNSKKNVTTDKKHILRKPSLKFQNPKFSFSCRIALYIFFVIKCETFGVKRSIRSFWNKQKWLNKIACFSFLIN